MDGDELVGQAEGRKLVEDGVPGGKRAKPVGLSRHRSASGWGAVVIKDRTGLQVMQCGTPLLTGFPARSKLKCFLGRQETPRHNHVPHAPFLGAHSYIALYVTHTSSSLLRVCTSFHPTARRLVRPGPPVWSLVRGYR